jgi:4-amino-4-deoxy-L-arabinose transferase-like glycosyltransferase
VIIDPHKAQWETWLHRWFVPLLIPAILVNAGGLLIPILEPDGALYATIAKTIARSGNFADLYVDGNDWLDKPHFPFWMAALSMRVFGVSGFAYKFPALVFWAAGAGYTWRFARSLYGKPVAQLATLLYVSAAHLVISNNDVRAEPYLTGLIIGAVYHFYKASRSLRPWLHLLAGSALSAAALMTKGPFVLLTIGAGFIVDWIIGKEWDQFHNLRWWVAILLIALFTVPELYCLYIQFDQHPEKVVFGRTGVSGIRFFFWDSQFGRFFNTGPIKGRGDPFFYFHTVLWAFLPWSLLLYAAVIRRCRSIHRAVPGDWICAGAVLASFVLFSLSRFQLPHYLNILFPFFAILTASWLYGIRREGTCRFVRIVQGIINIVLPVLLLVLAALLFFPHSVLLLTVIVIGSGVPFISIRGAALSVPIARSFWLALLVFSFVNFVLYPAILRYQAGTQAGRWIERFRPDASALYLLQEAPVNYSVEFYSPVPVRRVSMDSLNRAAGDEPALVFAPAAFADTLTRHGWHATILQTFPNFHISQLTGEFINAKTRDKVVEEYALILIRARAVAAGDWDIQQPEKYAKLGPVMDDLAVSHADDLALGSHLQHFFPVAEGPGFGKGLFGYGDQMLTAFRQGPVEIVQ